MEKKSLLRWDTKHIIKHSFISIIFTGILIGFLFFLFNTFSGLVIKEKEIDESIISRIGMYFYIKDENEQVNDEVYKKVYNIINELGENGIKSEFSSKTEADERLETKMPGITDLYEKFGIESKMTSRLYVVFKNEKEYNIMKDIIVKNKDIIANVKDVDKGATLQEQENRYLRIIGILKAVKWFTIIMAIVLGVIIIVFTQHLLRHFFYESYRENQVKKLLGATHTDANGGFIFTLLSTITIGFIIGYLLWRSTCGLLNIHLESININLGLTDRKVMAYLLIPYIVFSAIALTTGQLMLVKMEKKF